MNLKWLNHHLLETFEGLMNSPSDEKLSQYNWAVQDGPSGKEFSLYLDPITLSWLQVTWLPICSLCPPLISILTQIDSLPPEWDKSDQGLMFNTLLETFHIFSFFHSTIQGSLFFSYFVMFLFSCHFLTLNSDNFKVKDQYLLSSTA